MRLKAGQFYLFNGITNGTLITVPNILIKAKRYRKEEDDTIRLDTEEENESNFLALARIKAIKGEMMMPMPSRMREESGNKATFHPRWA